jgi:hypothetical protein
MELGATVCRPKNPECVTCPANHCCQAYAEWKVCACVYGMACVCGIVVWRVGGMACVYGNSGMACVYGIVVRRVCGMACVYGNSGMACVCYGVCVWYGGCPHVEMQVAQANQVSLYI